VWKKERKKERAGLKRLRVKAEIKNVGTNRWSEPERRIGHVRWLGEAGKEKRSGRVRLV